MYAKLQPGDPLAAGTLLGPLHTPQAVAAYEDAIDELRGGGAELLCGGSRYGNSSMADHLLGGNFVQPAISIPRSSSPHEADLWKKEVFAPILNVAIFDELEQAIEWNNAVPQGLSSSLWTRDIRNVGRWIGPEGSDTGIVNVNVGTSGAEIGAAFGGNKVCLLLCIFSAFILSCLDEPFAEYRMVSHDPFLNGILDLTYGIQGSRIWR